MFHTLLLSKTQSYAISFITGSLIFYWLWSLEGHHNRSDRGVCKPGCCCCGTGRCGHGKFYLEWDDADVLAYLEEEDADDSVDFRMRSGHSFRESLDEEHGIPESMIETFNENEDEDVDMLNGIELASS